MIIDVQHMMLRRRVWIHVGGAHPVAASVCPFAQVKIPNGAIRASRDGERVRATQEALATK